MDFYVLITWIKNGPLEAFLGQFRRFGGHEVGSSLFALFRPDMAQKCDIGCSRAFVGAAPIFFALQALHPGRFALFCRKQGAFMWVYVAVSRFQERLLVCVFTWVTLSSIQGPGPRVASS